MKSRVLIFEDNRDFRDVLHSLLGEFGFEVYSFPNPEPFLTIIGRHCRCSRNLVCADFIISDVNMPIVSGLELVSRQMEKGCRIKDITLMSGDWIEADLEYAEKTGCRVLYKPFGLEEIVPWLESRSKRIQPERRLLNWTRSFSNRPLSDISGAERYSPGMEA